ncbi:unnamed protein product [Phytomonas sp. Hart1]|nr:unnamed protein product [Phytomonas sp. Hart1]|eukprot:CCW66611.1 unnamed protein product [Phytomonas sp. isolate Hart1]
MNYHKFYYVTYKKGNSRGSSPRSLVASPTTTSDSSLPPSYLGRYPIRVTPSALPSLLYTFLYVIEFHAPVAPHPAPLQRSLRIRQNPSSAPNSSLAAALPAATAVFSAVLSFFGKTTSAGNTMNNINMDNTRETCGFPDIPHTLNASQEEELAALRRVHEQPFVVPVTQLIHKLGDTQIVVCETHNPTIAPAYERALKEINAIVEQSRREQSERRMRIQSQRNSVFSSPNSSSSKRISFGTSFTTMPAATTTKDLNSRPTACEPVFPGAAEVHERNHSIPFPPRGSPECNQSGSDVFGSLATAPQRVLSSLHCTRSGGGEKAIPAIPQAFWLQPGEVGLEISIRLSVNEVRWHVPQTRPLAEWTFLVIQTSDENTVLQMAKGTTLEDNDGMDEAGGQRVVSSGGNLMFINDPSQVEDVIHFISKTFYETISMETFSDFTSGELVFDVQTQKCHSFI